MAICAFARLSTALLLVSSCGRCDAFFAQPGLLLVGRNAHHAPTMLSALEPSAGDGADVAKTGRGGARGGGRGRGRGGGRESARSGGRGRGRAAGRGAASAPARGRTVRYITEQEMESEVRAAAMSQGFDEAKAAMLASCGRNIYSIGCEYHPSTLTVLEELCKPASREGETWALVLLRCMSGQMPRLRSLDAARIRLDAARAAARRRKRANDAQPTNA